jgi:hypothetical protein
MQWNTQPENVLTIAGKIPNIARSEDGKSLLVSRSAWPRLLFVTAVVIIAAFARLIPHPPNVSPVGALALFGGAFFPRKYGAFFVPLAAMLLSDLVLGLHALVPVVYGCIALNVLLGRWLCSRRQFVPIALATVAGAVQFFVITNFACWVLYYPHTLEGLCGCYIAAIPFFHNTLIGDMAFTTVLFGGLALAETLAPILREQCQLSHQSAMA